MKIDHIHAFTDNYIWVIRNDTQVTLVDPGEPTLPSNIGLEKTINPFLLQKIPENLKDLSQVDCFRELRIAKDNF